ncbi:TPA: hypothetical protein ACGUW2_004119 [Vibrio vulnificus]|uniref:defense against restriction DarA-related protein n=1 Tax=Vibrio parahaemolyticus TaxID=670 RepID=UPI0024AE943C|nr:hypothetical protein [Vibrio parahaemolyticus]MDI7855061.1 hypothetical protein [Vibrio parahaemolyticus]
MNPANGLKIYAMPDPLAKGFTRSQIKEAMYQLTADPEQEALMLEAEPFAVMDTAYVEGVRVEAHDGFILDAVTTSYATFPRTMKALARALNRSLSSSNITVTDHEVGEPKKNNLFATVAAQFILSDGQAVSVVFHAPDEDPKVFKPDDVVIAFRWLLNKRDITQVVAPEMNKGKMREVSLSTIGKRIGNIAAANSEAFQAKQKEVTESRNELASLQESSNALLDELNTLTTEVAQLEGRDKELEHMVTVKSDELAERQRYNDSLREKIAALKAAQPAPEPSPAPSQGEGEPQPEEENAALERFKLVEPSLFKDVVASISTIAAIDRGEEKGLTRSLFVSSIVNKLKTRHNNGQSEVVDAALDFISEVQKSLDKPIISARNAVWSLHSNATGSKEEKDESATPDSPEQPITPTPEDTPAETPDAPDESQKGENDNMNEQSVGDKPQAVLTLENIVNGVHDDVAADDVLEMIEEASEELEKLGLVEEYDALIGSAVEKYAELDEKQE